MNSRHLRQLAKACGFAALLVAPLAARADWDPTQPAKWYQLPDLSNTGMDVYDTARNLPGVFDKILADDFLCQQPGPITDVHIWGSWLHDILPTDSNGLPNPNAATFKLSIHSDVPAGATGPSHPGAELWSAVMPPGSYASRVYASGVTEQFYDPNQDLIIGTDTVVWQYNFTNLPSQFVQQGTTATPIIYWLDVQALVPIDPVNPTFGWKTSLQHFQDDAVFADTDPTTFPGGLITPWTDMHYPAGHPLAPQSIDLSFAITTAVPEPASLALLTAGALLVLRRRRRVDECSS